MTICIHIRDQSKAAPCFVKILIHLSCKLGHGNSIIHVSRYKASRYGSISVCPLLLLN